MELKQAYKVLELPQSASISDVKEAYRDLAQIWHPDRYSHNERLQKKALNKMKEINAAYDCLCRYLDKANSEAFTSRKSEHQGSNGGFTWTIIVCPHCGANNRAHSNINLTAAKCGKCGKYLVGTQTGQPPPPPKPDPHAGSLCGDGACTGVIGFNGSCGVCGRSYDEGVASEKVRTEESKQKHSQETQGQKQNKKVILYYLVGIGIFLLLALIFNTYHTGSFSRTVPDISDPAGQKKSTNQTIVSEALKAPTKTEPVNPNRLKTGAAPYIGWFIGSGHSEITVDNGTDSDSVVKVMRLGNDASSKIRNFYIRAHERFTAKRIPSGEYVLRVSFGMDWNPKIKKFNYRKSFSETQAFTINETSWTESKEDGEMVRTRSSNISITLHKVPHGNFRSNRIDEDKFLE
ncbi:MAG TPA: J domain-containing protein [Syntrophorhabdaceae bacterium]|jgi:hypothetical protein